MRGLQALGLSGVRWNVPAGIIENLPIDRPVLFYGNHASNWDGFLYWDLQKRLRPGNAMFSLMLEPELRRLPIFRRLGGVGIDPGSASSGVRALRALRVTRALRATRSDFCFTVFPQGATWPSAKRPLGFQGGLLHFARALAPVTLLPVAVHFEQLGSLRPHAFVSTGVPIACDAEPPPLDELEGHVTTLLDAVQAELAHRGEAFVRGSYGEGET